MYPVTVLLNILGQLLVFLSDLAVVLFQNCIDANVYKLTVVLSGKQYEDDDYSAYASDCVVCSSYYLCAYILDE